MNQKIKFLKKYFSIALIIFIISCEGEQGPMGPMGPKGDKGEPGISDIISVTYEVKSDAWEGNTNGYSVSLYVPEITNAVFQNGAVLIYLINEDKSPVTSNLLPYTWMDGVYTEYMDADIYVNGITIFFRWINNGVNSTKRPNSKFVYKIVIFEGTPISTLKSFLNISSLNDVENYINCFNNNKAY